MGGIEGDIRSLDYGSYSVISIAVYWDYMKEFRGT